MIEKWCDVTASIALVEGIELLLSLVKVEEERSLGCWWLTMKEDVVVAILETFPT